MSQASYENHGGWGSVKVWTDKNPPPPDVAAVFARHGRAVARASFLRTTERKMDPATIALMVMALNVADAIFSEAQKKHDAGAMSDEEFEDIKQQREAAMNRARDADNAP